MNNLRAYAPAEFRGVSTNNLAIKSWRSATTDNAARNQQSPKPPCAKSSAENPASVTTGTLASMRAQVRGFGGGRSAHWNNPHFRDAQCQ